MLCISDRQTDRTVQEAASGNDTLTGNCVHKSADFLLSTIYPWKTGSFYASISSTIYPWKTGSFYASISSTIYPWKTGSFYASISRWVITYCFDINVKICNVLICLELIKMLPKSIHQIALFSFQNSKIFQLLRGAHPPSDTPLCAQARNWRWRATQSSPPPNVQNGSTPLFPSCHPRVRTVMETLLPVSPRKILKHFLFIFCGKIQKMHTYFI